eukprot:1152560-Pelagomonas_calceolata.AAC.5
MNSLLFLFYGLQFLTVCVQEDLKSGTEACNEPVCWSTLEAPSKTRTQRGVLENKGTLGGQLEMLAQHVIAATDSHQTRAMDWFKFALCSHSTCALQVLPECLPRDGVISLLNECSV